MKLNAMELFAYTSTSAYIKTSDLEVGKSYKIIDMQRVDTQYGQKFVAFLDDGRKYQLPNRSQTVAEANKVDLKNTKFPFYIKFTGCTTIGKYDYPNFETYECTSEDEEETDEEGEEEEEEEELTTPVKPKKRIVRRILDDDDDEESDDGNASQKMPPPPPPAPMKKQKTKK
jgi:hypothetical protein